LLERTFINYGVKVSGVRGNEPKH